MKRSTRYDKPSSSVEGQEEMKIGEIAAQSGVPPKTLRFWEDEDLLPPPARTASGYRDYTPAVLERVRFIRQAQAAGFTLGQISQILSVGDSGERPCAHVTDLIELRIGEVEARITELTRTRKHLAALAKRAAEQDLTDSRGYCSIITG
jgi:DNA-binding transcriptional MerR regulator